MQFNRLSMLYQNIYEKIGVEGFGRLSLCSIPYRNWRLPNLLSSPVVEEESRSTEKRWRNRARTFFMKRILWRNYSLFEVRLTLMFDLRGCCKNPKTFLAKCALSVLFLLLMNLLRWNFFKFFSLVKLLHVRLLEEDQFEFYNKRLATVIKKIRDVGSSLPDLVVKESAEGEQPDLIVLYQPCSQVSGPNFSAAYASRQGNFDSN